MKTFSLKTADIQKDWTLIDAQDIVVGRLAAQVAARLRGKHKPSFTPHMDCGDHIIVINAARAIFTGNKKADKIYYRHTGYPGGIRSIRAEEILAGRYPERVVLRAVKNMMPRGALAATQMKNLYVYAGAEHPHQGQNPVLLDLAALNRHNRRAVLAVDHAGDHAEASS